MAIYEPTEERLFTNGVQFMDPLMGELASLEMRSAVASQPDPGRSAVPLVSARRIVSSRTLVSLIREHADPASFVAVVTDVRMQTLHVLSVPLRGTAGQEHAVLKDLIRLAILGGGTAMLLARYDTFGLDDLTDGGSAQALRVDPMVPAILHGTSFKFMKIHDYLWVDDETTLYASARDLMVME